MLKYHRQLTNANWAINAANEPSNVRLLPGHFRLPIFEPTIDAAESPMPTLIIPLNCANGRSLNTKKKERYKWNHSNLFTIIG